MHHPAAVVLAVLGVERLLDDDAVGQQPPVVQVLGDDPDGRGVDVAERRARRHGGDAGLLRGVHRVVDPRWASVNVPFTGRVRVMSAV